MYRVLIIEDEEAIARGIKKQVESWNLEARCAEDFQNVMDEFTRYRPHLVLLDIFLPFYNGHYWCQEIRKVSSVPVIFISSASDNMNIVMAIQMGGDDFIAKPFDYAVMTAKIQAVLRRAYDYTAAPSMPEHRGAVLNLQDATLQYQDKKLNLPEMNIGSCRHLWSRKGKSSAGRNLWKSCGKATAL